MKLKALLLSCTLALALAAPAFANTDEILLGFTGMDYQSPNPSGTYLDLGEGYNQVGFVTSFGALLTPWVDTSLYEYTIHTFGLTVNGRFFTSPFLTVTFNNNGRSRYYRDALSGGTPGTYGINPPNATSPSTFIDGSMRVGGDVDNFVLTYDFSINDGNFSGDMTLDEGPDLIYVPAGQRAGWVLGGINNHGLPNNPSVPAGYDHQVEGECRIPKAVPTTHKTWGAVKALYR